MPYFPVDDGLHSHPKAIKAGASAIGLWALCGSWSNDHGTDGFVPEFIVSRFVASGKRVAARLVTVGLWTVAERDGERGWQFHQWEGDEKGRRNYTRAEVDQRRREGAERQAKSRQRRATQQWGVTRDKNVTDPSVTPNVTRDRRVSASDPSHTHPKEQVQSQNPGGAVGGSLTKQDRPNGSNPGPLDGIPEQVDTGEPAKWKPPKLQLPREQGNHS